MIERGNFAMMMMLLIALLVLGANNGVEAWAVNPGGKQPKSATKSRRPPSSVNYAPSNMPTTETPSFVAQKMLMNGVTTSSNRKGSSLTLSQSVLASCDTLPSFPTSHGLLSPETVMRMEELTAREGHTSQALVSFLKTYKRHGPMSCLPMLSDPDILPHLTNAMRESML